MDFSKSHVWQVVVKFEKIAGFWPFQKRIKNAAICLLSLMVICSFAVPLAIRLFHEWTKNVAIVVENLVTIMLVFSTSIKVLANYCFQERRKNVYSRIAIHLKNLQDEELKIMTDYIEFGLKFTLAYIATAGVALVIFDGPSLWEMILSIFVGNNSTDKPLPYYFEYGIDHNKYYNYIIFHIIVTEISAAVVLIAYDLSFIVVVQHNCALLKIATHRLKKALEVAARYRKSQEVFTYDECEAHRLLIMAIDIHNEALQLVVCIDDVYSLSWFFKLIETVISTGALLSVLIAITTNALDFVRYLAYLAFTLIQFNIPFNRGQQIIDLSSDVSKACYDCEWENLSKESVFLLRMIMVRSSKASNLTGGKIFALSNEIYGKMLKTAFSYCAMFNSFVK